MARQMRAQRAQRDIGALAWTNGRAPRTVEAVNGPVLVEVGHLETRIRVVVWPDDRFTIDMVGEDGEPVGWLIPPARGRHGVKHMTGYLNTILGSRRGRRRRRRR